MPEYLAYAAVSVALAVLGPKNPKSGAGATPSTVVPLEYDFGSGHSRSGCGGGGGPAVLT